MNQEEGNWWTRPCGGREVWAIALPLVISTMSFTVMHFCDRMFLAWYATSTMAAATMAGALHWTVCSFPLGVATYANTFVAQYHGAERPERIGATVWQALRIGLYTSPLFLAVALFSPELFRVFGHSPELLWLEVSYFRILAFGSGAIVMSTALTAFFIGRGETRVVMWVDILAAAMNIVLDLVWIFGYLGFPASGIEGAAWATVLSQWFKIVLYLVLMHRGSNPQTYGLVSGRRLDRALLTRLMRFGGPNGLQFVVEGAAFTIFLLLIGQLGEVEAAASSVALSVNMVAFVPMIGVGLAVSTLVGQQIGRGRPDLAVRATWTACAMGLMYTAVFGALYILAPDLLMLGHAMGAKNFGEIRALAVVLLRFVAAYCLFDAMQLIFVSAIKGAGDTSFVMRTTLVLSTGFVVIGVVGARFGGWGIMWWWLMITGWILMFWVVYLARFLQGRWRKMRVIEMDVVKAEEVESLQPSAITCGD